MTERTPVRAKAKVNVRTPMVPNFLLIGDGQSLAVSCFDDAELRAIGERWTEELIAKAHRQRANVDSEYRRSR